MTLDLIDHMIQKRHPCIDDALTGAIEIDRTFDLGLSGIALDGGGARWTAM